MIPTRISPALAVGFLMLIGVAASARAATTLHVYGAEGPAAALTEAAATYERATGVHVELVCGPPAQWLASAAADADIVVSAAEFMMSSYLANPALQVDGATVTPLYMRPSAIIVRLQNPRRIEDLPDLLRSGINVMVVDGSGQTGLWEDMIGGSEDPKVLQRLRENIVVHAASSTEAVRLWRERADIDAWITWNIWHVPLRTESALVQVSAPYRIYRQCSAALTRRGAANPRSQEFVEFLLSADGREIFLSWGWMTLD